MILFRASSGNTAEIRGRASGANLAVHCSWAEPPSETDAEEANRWFEFTFPELHCVGTAIVEDKDQREDAIKRFLASGNN